MYTEHNARWDKDNGNHFLVATYPLTEESWVIELGGFMGNWTKRIYDNYKSNIIVIEPIEDFCNVIKRDLSSNEKIKIEQLGISTEPKDVMISHNGDASSQYLEQTSNQITIHCEPLEYFLDKYNVNKVDLMQVNVEGEEFPLFEHWLKSDILSKFKFIQIQFHRMGTDYEERKQKIQEGLRSKGFVCNWEYPYVFESWENKNL
jgi:FkbM family methyltransferase